MFHFHIILQYTSELHVTLQSAHCLYSL